MIAKGLPAENGSPHSLADLIGAIATAAVALLVSSIGVEQELASPGTAGAMRCRANAPQRYPICWQLAASTAATKTPDKLSPHSSQMSSAPMRI